jgi:hypothetical protein
VGVAGTGDGVVVGLGDGVGVAGTGEGVAEGLGDGVGVAGTGVAVGFGVGVGSGAQPGSPGMQHFGSLTLQTHDVP